MRNRIAHSYDVLDETTIWGAATEHVPGLVTRLEELLNDYQDPAALDSNHEPEAHTSSKHAIGDMRHTLAGM